MLAFIFIVVLALAVCAVLLFLDMWIYSRK